MLENIETIFDVTVLTAITAFILWGLWATHERAIEQGEPPESS